MEPRIAREKHFRRGGAAQDGGAVGRGGAAEKWAAAQRTNLLLSGPRNSPGGAGVSSVDVEVNVSGLEGGFTKGSREEGGPGGGAEAAPGGGGRWHQCCYRSDPLVSICFGLACFMSGLLALLIFEEGDGKLLGGLPVARNRQPAFSAAALSRRAKRPMPQCFL